MCFSNVSGHVFIFPSFLTMHCVENIPPGYLILILWMDLSPFLVLSNLELCKLYITDTNIKSLLSVDTQTVSSKDSVDFPSTLVENSYASICTFLSTVLIYKYVHCLYYPKNCLQHPIDYLINNELNTIFNIWSLYISAEVMLLLLF